MSFKWLWTELYSVSKPHTLASYWQILQTYSHALQAIARFGTKVRVNGLKKESNQIVYNVVETGIW